MPTKVRNPLVLENTLWRTIFAENSTHG